MKPHRVILDTGPLVAYLNRNDRYHQWAVTQFSQLQPPFITCESVLSEACFLLRHVSNGQKVVLEMLERGLFILPLQLQEEAGSIATLMEKYRNVPMSLADGCLVRLSEQISNSKVCTLDSDFKIYRKNKRNMIPLIIPEV